MKLLRFFAPIVFFLFSHNLAAQQIIGMSSTCTGYCYNYYLEGSDGSILISPDWAVSDQLGNPASFTLANDGGSIEVCFPTFGVYTIEVLYNGQLYTFSLFAGEFTDLEFIARVQGCPPVRKFSQNCFEICTGQEVQFQIANLTPTNIQWFVFPDGVEIISETTNSITIKTGLAPGYYNISYFGSIDQRCFFEGSFCIQVVEPPIADFETNIAPVDDTITVCSGQTLIFSDKSGAKNVFWYTSDGSAASSAVFKKAFNIPGLYQLTQVASNGCKCEDEKKVFIRVLEEELPVIYCTATACLGDTAIYHTDSGCDPYQWTISNNGVIIAGGGPGDNFIRVHWLSGGSGEVSLIHACADECPFPATVEIPLIGSDNRIVGPELICANTQYTYSTENMSGTNFIWSTSSSGNILSGQGTSSVSVIFTGSIPMPFIYVEYENCQLGCTGRDTLRLQVQNRFEVTGPARICSDETAQWSAHLLGQPGNAANVLWELRTLSGTLVYNTSTPSSIFTLPDPDITGTFRLVAVYDGPLYCNREYAVNIRIDASPEMPLSIVGPDLVCPGAFYSYSLTDNNASLRYLWTATEAGDVFESSGSVFEYSWKGNEPMSLSVLAFDPITGCQSETLTIPINLLQQLELEADGTFCAFGRAVFTVTGDQVEDVSWTLSNPNNANLLDHPNSQSIRYKWLEAGPITVTASYCNLTLDTTVTIDIPFTPLFTYKDTICNEIKEQATTDIDYATYYWMKDGEVICDTRDCDLGAGDYVLIVYDQNGCIGRDSFSVVNINLPDIFIYAVGPPVFCSGDSVQIIAVDESATGTLVYTWFRNGVAIAETDPSFFVTEFGVYYREVFDPATGCTLRSNSIAFCENCDPDNVCLSCPCGDLIECDSSLPPLEYDLTMSAECDLWTFTATTPGLIESSITWVVFDFRNPAVFLTGNNRLHRFRNAGPTLVILTAQIIDINGDTLTLCPSATSIIVPAVAEFEFDVKCQDEPTIFRNRIAVDGNFSITDILWDFDDPASGTENNSSLSNPTHIFSAPGPYNVTLRVDVDAGCFVTAEHFIFIIPLPDATFTHDAPVCANTALIARPNDTGGIFYEWYFDEDNLPGKLLDTHVPGEHGYDVGGTYTVKLVVTDRKGCVSEHSEQIEVYDPPGPGIITADKAMPLCKDDIVTLSVADDNVSYLWSNGADTKDIEALESGIYRMTVTDQNGCVASRGPIGVIYYNLPETGIVASASDGLAGTVFAPDTLEVCEGSAVNLRALGIESGFNFLWNNGHDQINLIFNGADFPLLALGTHQFSVEVLDLKTNCSILSDTITVIVNESPGKPRIIGDISKPWCADIPFNMMVENTEPGVMYTWSGGQIGTSIAVSLPGDYSVLATNDFGCSAVSDQERISGAPNLSFLPDGCFTACEQDTFCFNLPNGIQILEWLKDGVSMNPAPADLSKPDFTESGSYSAVIRTTEGCEFTTQAVNYTIDPGQGAIGGSIFLDRDGDGIFSPGDSLLAGIRVWLEGTMLFDSTISNPEGVFFFNNLPIGQYFIRIDTSGLPDGWVAVLDTTTVELTECDEEITNISIPIIECPNDTSNFQLRLCFGESVDINGVIYEFETDTLLLLESATVPCKSYEVYDITVLPRVPDMAVWIDRCEGDFVDIDGVLISNDSVFSKIYPDVNGCDSLVHFVVEFAPLTREQVEFKFCPGDEVKYRDLTILNDTLFDYRIIGLSGECDTVITIQATTFDPPMASPETLDACPDVDDGLIRVISNQIFELVLNGQNLGNTNLIRNLPSGSYQLELIDLNGCELDFDLTINRKPPLEANIEEIFLECSGDMVPLIVNVSSGEDDELSIRWLNGQVGDSLLVDRPGLYFAEVRNSCQVKTIQGRATLTGVGNGVLHFVPHAFTPNGDDINDTFLTFWAEGVEFESFELEVFDRWGERQFRTNDPNIGWNGIMKGKDEKVAVYVWKLNAQVRYCNEIYTIVDYGDVTLLN